MRFVWLGVVALSGLVACGAELEGRGDATDADSSADLDTTDTHEVDSVDIDTHEVDTHDTREEIETLDEVDGDTDPETHDEVETLEDVDTGDGADLLEDADSIEDMDAVGDGEVENEVDADDTRDDIQDLWDGDTSDTVEDAWDGDTSDTSPEIHDDTDDVVEVDTTEPLDTVDNPCLFPAGLHPERYRPMAELRGAELRAALQAHVSEGSVGFDYDAARDLMYGITDAIDVDADLTIECVYTGYRRLADGTRSPGSGLTEITTEHSWPRSDGAAVFPAEGDIHHLFPALAPANNNRGNDEFGDVACGVGWPRSCAWADGGSFLGPAIDGRSSVFQVRSEHRGDIARAHFYFAVRYNRPIPSLEEETLRRWHCEDPPSPRERARNDRIEVHQKNRNPFVDQPFWVERISDY